MASQSIGLLTGTFDPIHLGHVALAKAAITNMGLDEVWILVNSKRINSPVESKTDVTSFERRLAMAELAAVGESNIKVYAGELMNEPHNMQTFLSLMDRYPSSNFVFVMGMDVLARLDGWRDVQSVVEKSTFAVAVRPGAPSASIADLKLRLGKLGTSLDVRVFEFRYYSSETSTRIRNLLKIGKRPRSLDGGVYTYIVANHLYC
jgi:nicotinate-nucleotide adenylyltransferase